MLQDYVYVSSLKKIKLATEVTEEDKGVVYMGRFLSYEEAKMYHESCIGKQFGFDYMARAKVYCEITCNSCGTLLIGSGYYKNASIISKLKSNANESGWVWDEEFGGNLCPSCQEEVKEERRKQS